MVMEFVYTPGQTPLDPDEMGGLKPRHITTQEQLNAWEQVNILAGRFWAFRQSKKVELLDENFIRRLHLKMFGNTWSWAGTFRTTDKSIGVAAEKVAMRLVQLMENTRYQRDNATFPADELVIRFHHELVFILLSQTATDVPHTSWPIFWVSVWDALLSPGGPAST